MSRPGQQPVSYRTVPGRHRTQKWQAASKQTYDGDDWGDYDPYDEYGGAYGEQEQPPPLPSQGFVAAAQQSQQFQQPQNNRATRRVNSFDQGDENRLFVSTAGPAVAQSTLPFPAYDPHAVPLPPSSNIARPDSKGRPRDFTNPDEVPPPLMTRAAPAPPEWFPPRKSSLSGSPPPEDHPAIFPGMIPATAPTSSTSDSAATAAAVNVEKPLPFIRPSDIYKRIPEELERERRSEESSRPSMDSVQRETDSSSPQASSLTAGPRTNLATVTESRESRLYMDEPNQPSQASIVDEQRRNAPATIGAQSFTDLQHQPSQGFRSAVHQAFDRADEPSSSLSQDGSQSNSENVSRSNTTSTISPIMSHVPAPITSQQQIPPIVEETGIAAHGPSQVLRKPSPQRSPPAEFEPGYRRSLGPPTTEESPARTPTLEDTATRRLSTPMMAETVATADPPDVPDQAAEIPDATLRTIETFATEPTQAASAPFSIVGRGRSGTDYSVREADLANTVNASTPDKVDLAETVAEARASQALFLNTHAATPTTPSSISGASVLAGSRTGTPTNAGPGSPSKGRVREIAGQYQEIHNASRRNSASSIGSNTRHGVRPSTEAADAIDAASLSGNSRPTMDREASFRPQLPGGWISAAATPTEDRPEEENEEEEEEEEEASPTTPLAEPAVDKDEPVDLMPTTRKVPLQEVVSNRNVQTPFDVVKSVGDQLGAALLASAGSGHQTRDFASSEPAEPIQLPQVQSFARSGPIAMQPLLERHETDDSDTLASVASSKPPTPLPKDTPKMELPNPIGASSDHLSPDYLDPTIPPLRLSSRQGSAEPLNRVAEPPRSLAANTLSTISGADDTESDRLRKEIVRSLENAEHDSLGVPTNEPEGGQTAAPTPAASASNSSDLRAGNLNHKFSWENLSQTPSTSNTATEPAIPVIATVAEPESPEIKPERAYERPRSSVLQVVNVDMDEDIPPIETIPELRELEAAEADDQATLRPQAQKLGGGSASPSLQELAPTPMTERATSVDSGPRLPSYYLGSHQSESFLEPPEKDHTTSSSMSPSASDEPSKSKIAPIPPFRNILAMKSSGDRIRTYNETRQTFADMDTGLSDWLSTMLENHPEHADVASGKPLVLQTSGIGTFKRSHKPSPSIMKFTKQFTEPQRSASGGSIGEDGVVVAQRRPSIPGNDRLDMDKMQQRGKDLMKSAGVLGGKAQAGAKGLFAKGKSRFANRRDSDKALLPSIAASNTVSSSPLPPPDLPTTKHHKSLRGGAAPSSNSSATPSLKSPSAEPSISISLRPSLSLNSRIRTTSSSSPDEPADASPHHQNPLSKSLSLFRSRSRTKSNKSKANSKSPGPFRLGPRSRPTSLVLSACEPLHSPESRDLRRSVVEAVFRLSDTGSTDHSHATRIPGAGSRKEVWENDAYTPAIAADDTVGAVRKPGQGTVSESQSDVRATVSAVPAPTSSSETGVKGNERRLTIPSLGSFGNIADRQQHLERLGVLPSPAETTRTFDFGGPASESLPTSPSSPRKHQVEDDRDRDRDMRDSGPSAYSPIAVGRRERKGSDLALLPSQQIRKRTKPLQEVPVKGQRKDGEGAEEREGEDEDKERKEEDDEETEEVVFRANPITVKSVQPILVTRRGKKPEGDQENFYAVTPMAQKASLITSRDDDEMAINHEEGTTVAAKSLNVAEGSDVGASENSPVPTVETVKTTENEARDEENLPQHAPDSTDPDVNIEPRQRPRSGVWNDARSEISAEEQEHTSEPTRRDSAVSRRSSVSSLGGPGLALATAGFHHLDDHNVAEEAPIMSAQAVPAGPIGSTPASPMSTTRALAGMTQEPASERLTSQENADFRERFASRSYQQRPGAERPLSYVPLPRDEAGAPVQETLHHANTPFSASAQPGSSAGVPKFQPHPAVRPGIITVQPTEYELLRTSTPHPVDPTETQESQANKDAKKRRSRQLPGLLRKTRRADDDATSARKEDSSEMVEAPQSGPAAQTIHEDKNGRRRSAVLETILSVRRPSLADPSNVSKDSSFANVPAGLESGRQADIRRASDASKTRHSTLRKPQRSASTASSQDIEPKKKRFSGLGMLFGRSSTTGHASPKPARLSKEPHPSPSKETSQSPVTGPNRESGNTVIGSVRGYAEFEALRRKEMPAFQENALRHSPSQVAHPLSPRREPKLPNLDTMPEDSTMPPPGGWYGPGTSDHYHPPPREHLPSSAQVGPPPPQFRRTPSSGRGPGISFENVPEAFRPTSMSFNGPVQPVEPPPEPYAPRREISSSRSGLPHSMSQRRQGSYSASTPPAMTDLSGQRYPSSGSEISQLSRQMSGYSNADLRSHSVSPVHPRPGYNAFPPPREFRSGSIGQELARSPSGGIGGHETWGPPRSHGASGSQQRMRSPPEPQNLWYLRSHEHGASSEESYFPQDPYRDSRPPRPTVQPPPYQAQTGPVFTPQTANSAGYSQWSPRQHMPQPQHMRGGRSDASGYVSPPYSPTSPAQSPPYTQPARYFQPRPMEFQQPGPSPGDFHAQPASPPPLPHVQRKPVPSLAYPSSANSGIISRPRHYNEEVTTSLPRSLASPPPGPSIQSAQRQREPWTSSSATRREELVAGDEELQMRGASYPGQEWAPSGLGGGDWD